MLNIIKETLVVSPCAIQIKGDLPKDYVKNITDTYKEIYQLSLAGKLISEDDE